MCCVHVPRAHMCACACVMLNQYKDIVIVARWIQHIMSHHGARARGMMGDVDCCCCKKLSGRPNSHWQRCYGVFMLSLCMKTDTFVRRNHLWPRLPKHPWQWEGLHLSHCSEGNVFFYIFLAGALHHHPTHINFSLHLCLYCTCTFFLLATTKTSNV